MNHLTQGSNPHTPDGAPADADYVVYRLEEAGAALLALPSSGYTTRLRTSVLDVVRDTVEAFASAPDGRVRPPVPSAGKITRMDEALGWIARIPGDRYVLRRIVGARSLVSPVTERHLFTWRRLAAVLGADHKAVQRWHAQGVGLIVAALNTADAAPARHLARAATVHRTHLDQKAAKVTVRDSSVAAMQPATTQRVSASARYALQPPNRRARAGS